MCYLFFHLGFEAKLGFFFFFDLGSGNLRWKFVSKKIAMIIKEDGFASQGNKLTMVFMGSNKVILMPNSLVVCIEYKLDFLAES